MALSFAEILAVDDLPCEEIEVPEWKGAVRVRVLRADERSDIERLFIKKKPSDDPGGFRAEILRKTLLDPSGGPLLADDDAARAFMGKSAAAVERLFEAACRLNGFRGEDVEELEGN